MQTQTNTYIDREKRKWIGGQRKEEWEEDG